MFQLLLLYPLNLNCLTEGNLSKSIAYFDFLTNLLYFIHFCKCFKRVSENAHSVKVLVQWNILKSKESPQTFVPKILVSWYPEWANCKGFLEPESVN